MIGMIEDKHTRIGITLPNKVLKKLDAKRGDVPRSKYIAKILEANLLVIVLGMVLISGTFGIVFAQGEKNSTQVLQKLEMCKQFAQENMSFDEYEYDDLSCGEFAASNYEDVLEYIINEQPRLMDNLDLN